MSWHREAFDHVDVVYDKDTHYLFIYDYETGKHLATFYVKDEDRLERK